MNVLPHSLEAHIIYIALQRCQTPPTRRLERWPSKRLCTGDRIRTCNYVYRVYIKRASRTIFSKISGASANLRSDFSSAITPTSTRFDATCPFWLTPVCELPTRFELVSYLYHRYVLDQLNYRSGWRLIYDHQDPLVFLS